MLTNHDEILGYIVKMCFKVAMKVNSLLLSLLYKKLFLLKKMSKSVCRFVCRLINCVPDRELLLHLFILFYLFIYLF